MSSGGHYLGATYLGVILFSQRYFKKTPQPTQGVFRRRLSCKQYPGKNCRSRPTSCSCLFYLIRKPQIENNWACRDLKKTRAKKEKTFTVVELNTKIENFKSTIGISLQRTRTNDSAHNPNSNNDAPTLSLDLLFRKDEKIV